MADNDSQENLKSIYKIIEQDVNKDGEIITVERFYTEDFQFLGGNNKSDGIEYITLSPDFIDNDEINVSPDNATQFTVIKQNKDSRCSIKLVRDK